MENNLYALLIGIDDYKGQNLNQCVSDVKKVEDYLKDLNQDKYKFHAPKLLLDDEATKTNVVENISSSIQSLKKGDVFLLYFSGHGTQETSNARFVDEHNGRIQCMVCHPDGDIKNALLADKELRYLFSKLNTEAHIIAVFDCCHSGEITRGQLKSNKEKQERRMSVHFPPRAAEDFIFTKEVPLEEFKTKRFKEIFLDKNVVTLSASASHESSWEDSEGGVFTRNLLKILKQKESALNYNDVAKFTRLSIQTTTREKQTPTIDVYGDRQFNQMTSWLNLHGPNFYGSLSSISYNKNQGWLFPKGKLHGIEEHDIIEVVLSPSRTLKLPIDKLMFDHSILRLSQSQMDKLERDKTYKVLEIPGLLKPKIFINNLDYNAEVAEILKDVVDANALVELETSPENSDFDINIFNETVYFSFSNDAFRPLSNFINLIDPDQTENKILSELKNGIDEKLKVVQNWHHYSELEVKDEFNKMPIKIELSIDNGQNWTDISNGQISIEPGTQRSQNPGNPEFHEVQYRKCDFKISNLTSEKLYVTPITLNHGRLEISDPTGDGKSIELDGNNSKSFVQYLFINHYMEVYNWEQECSNYKFIVNNHSDLNAELPSILQEGLGEPYRSKGTTRGSMGGNAFEFQERNAIYYAKVILKNPTFNQISGELANHQERYMNDEVVSPFIQRLYFDIDPDSIDLKLKPKPNNGQVEEKGFKVWLGNTIDHHRRKRKFKKTLRQFPDKPIIVAEGDSWFLYPILVKDTLDHLMTEYPVKSLAWAGDTLENYKKSGALLKEVKNLKPKYVMISGGGNDIIGPDIVNILEANVAAGKEPRAYLNNKYDDQMKKLSELYTYFFKEILQTDSVQNILVHGYDYLRTDHAEIVVKGGWVSKYMKEKGINDHKDRKRLVDFLIDEFNEMMKKLAENIEKVTYVNLLDTINGDEWYDEIHPNDDGYKKIADKFKVHLV